MAPSDSIPLPSFDSVADRFITVGALSSPSELHGMLCGHLCGGGRYSTGEWLSAAAEFLEAARELDPDTRDLLEGLYRATLSQLKDHQLSLSLLLPEEDTDLSEQIAALAEWCHGFLTGFGTSGLPGDAQLSSEAADVLRDFAAFVQINPEDAEDADSETDFMEIVEYVRVAVLTLFMEVGKAARDAEGGDEPAPTLH